jgi:small subunit ribosomal protein S8
MIDQIADMLTRIRNAQKAGLLEVSFSASKLKLAIAKILEKEGFIESVAREKNNENDQIKIGLKYFKISNTKKNPAITEIKRISKQGQRIYVRNKDIKNVKNKYGIAIVSTSKGVMTGAEAHKNGLGGEYICEVW